MKLLQIFTEEQANNLYLLWLNNQIKNSFVKRGLVYYPSIDTDSLITVCIYIFSI